MLNRPISAIWVCVPLLLTACNRESESTSAPVTENASQPAASPTQPVSADPRSAPVATRPPSAIAIPTNDPAAMLSALTQALRKFSFEKRQVPANLEELASAGYLQGVPQPPAGKKFVIDKKRMIVELINQ